MRNYECDDATMRKLAEAWRDGRPSMRSLHRKVRLESAKLYVTERLAVMGFQVPDDDTLDARLNDVYEVGFQVGMEDCKETRVALRSAIRALLDADPEIETGLSARHVHLRESLKLWRLLARDESGS